MMNNKIKCYQLNYILPFPFNFNNAFTSATKYNLFEQPQKQL